MKGGIILAVAILAFIGIILFYKRSTRSVPTVEQLGPFGLVTHRTQYRYGWNEAMSRMGTDESYSLLYKGKPFTFFGKSGMFGNDTVQYHDLNSMITFPAPEPAVIVNVGDPNNSSFYYLVREVNGAAAAELLADSRGGVSAEWLDPPDESRKISDITLHRGRMEGGRWLLLGEYTVLDTRNLTAHTFGQNPEAGHNQFKPPMELSPDQRSFVRFGSTSPPENQPALVVYDFLAPSSYYLRLDRTIHRYNQWEEIDRAWLHHYFEWQKRENGHDVLVARNNVAPLPWRGSLSTSQGDTYREYRLLPVTGAMKDTLAAFIEGEMSGVRQPPAPQFGESVIVFKLGEATVFVSDSDDHASVYSEHNRASGRAVEAIGKRFDEELKSGRFDFLFEEKSSD